MHRALPRRTDIAPRRRNGLAKFALVGASGAVVNSAVLYALHEWSHLPLLVASVLAVEAAVISNYLLNDRWTFAARNRSLRRFARFNLSSLGGLAVNVLAVSVLSRFGLHFLLANLIGIAAGFAANFALSSTWVWAAA